MSVTKKIIAYVEGRDGVTVAQIAEAMNLERKVVAARLSQCINKLYREVDTATMPPRYIWYPKSAAKERVAKPQAAVATAEAPARKSYAGLFDKAVDSFVEAIVGNVMGQVEAKLTHALEEKVSAVISAIPARINPPLLEAPRKTKKSVCLVGLLPAQAGMIQQEFGDVFDLKFIDAGERNGHLKDAVVHSDKTFLMTGFISHATQELVKAQGVSPVLVSGGMTRLRDVLTDLFVGA